MVLRKEKTELFVGLFVLVGLAIMGTLVLQFGSFSERLKEKYQLTLLFPDGGDIVKGSPVRLGGAEVGSVAGDPALNEGSTGVVIGLEIYDGKKIPSNSAFTIATSGLMGDSYINITSPEKPDGTYLQAGATIEGDTGRGLSDFTEQGGELIDDIGNAVADIREAVVSLDSSIKKIEAGVLSEENISNLKDTLADFRATGANARTASEKFIPAVEKADEVMAKAKEAVEEVKVAVSSARETFETATGIVEKAGPAVDDFGPAIADLREAIAGINEAVQQITEGDGTAAALISDPELRANLASLIDNLNEHGILGYENDSAERKQQGAEDSAKNDDDDARGGARSKGGWLPFRR